MIAQQSHSGTLAGIPFAARPWDIVRASLPVGWGLTLIASQEPDGWLKVGALLIAREDGTDCGYTIEMREPVFVRPAELDASPAWVDQEIERRRAARA